MDNINLLNRAGFIKDGEVFLLNIAPYDMVYLTDAATGSAPIETTTSFFAVSPRIGEEDNVPSEFFDIVLETSDVRDVVAFAVAVRNQSVMAAGDEIEEDRLFGWDVGNLAIHNAFADAGYGDWKGERRTDWPFNDDGRALVVIGVEEMSWAKEYLEWRDSYCQNLLAEAPSPR